MLQFFTVHELRGLGLPVLCVQEGGYNTRQLGAHARRFINELAGRGGG